ncbi:MAG: hypothetical protein ACP5G1_01170 [Nanopusillaceae archaeon]
MRRYQFSVAFTTLLIVFFIVGIILITAFFSSLNLYNFERQNYFSYSQDIIYQLFSPNCIGYQGYSIYYTTYDKLSYYNKTFFNELPNCTTFPYPFRVYIENYSFGIINYFGNCDNISYPISINGEFHYMKLEICRNFYSDFYKFVYDFCINNLSSNNQSFIFLSQTYVQDDLICTENLDGKIICNKIPCRAINNITFFQSVRVYLLNLGNKSIKIV